LGLREGARRWSCFVTCLVTRFGDYAFARVAPYVRSRPRRGFRWDICLR